MMPRRCNKIQSHVIRAIRIALGQLFVNVNCQTIHSPVDFFYH